MPEGPVVEEKKVQEKVPIKMRQIIIETDGNDIGIVKADVAGSIELVAILRKLADHLERK